jgi:hypothetical protein
MRTVIALIAVLVLVASPATSHAKGKRQQQDTAKAEDSSKKKATEDAYKNAMKNIPVSTEKQDPWRTMR